MATRYAFHLLLRHSRASCPLTINFLVAFFLYGLIIVLELSLSVCEIAQFCRAFILFLKWSRIKNPCSIGKLKPNWNWVFEAVTDKDRDFFFIFFLSDQIDVNCFGRTWAWTSCSCELTLSLVTLNLVSQIKNMQKVFFNKQNNKRQSSSTSTTHISKTLWKTLKS